VNNSPYTSEPSVTELLTGLVNDAKVLLQQELALAKQEIRAELRSMVRAGLFLGIGAGIAAIGGLLLILMLVHLLHALTALPLWACYGIVGGLFGIGGVALLVIGKQKLAHLDLVPQDTVETMKENVAWIKKQVTADGTTERDQRW
jgi:Putative Actinobacterial Holin-X, holin superfamily III